MKKIQTLLFGLLVTVLFAGCSTERLPSEDLEVLQFYQKEIAVLKNPQILPNTREKYEAAKSLVEKVDFTFTRETKTLNDIFFFGDAIVSSETDPERTIAFNFQYGNKYVRLIFYCYDRFIFKVEEVVK
ncbi:MAG: hypothetical protein IJZ19_02475 [Lentisphaeria bacterium]|jgi:hypothetical protein|nr:hypothetical protein [Lentisphaeria bacterium]MBQ8753875.1 hypothetical protein [Lentisphaeria bacterium]MBQ9775184.1 hypothetical protein [Lentisphaeria bacterium]